MGMVRIINRLTPVNPTSVNEIECPSDIGYIGKKGQYASDGEEDETDEI